MTDHDLKSSLKLEIMYKSIVSGIFSIFLLVGLSAQDTFSIVALDEETGEVGSAGASCVVGAADLGGVILISDIVPGRGAINGQATVCIPHVNLQNGIDQMEAGLSPQAILDWLYDNDDCIFGTNESRQYGIVDFDGDGNARSAAFTGTEALDYAGHRVGSNYAIQGNILLGPEILDSMEFRFVNAEGSLAERLMAALQGANVPGADSRCLDDGTSSTSAFLQVYKPDDMVGMPSLRLNVMETATGVEPIDSLQNLFDEWLLTSTEDLVSSDLEVRVFPNPTQEQIVIEIPIEQPEGWMITTYDLNGRQIEQIKLRNSRTLLSLDAVSADSLMIYQITNAQGQQIKSGKILLKK